MKSYKEFETKYIGSSDISTLILVGSSNEGLKLDTMYFGEDGRYTAYIIDEDIKIPEHYTLSKTFCSWLKIYDDEELTQTFRAKIINIYQAGEFGCIIQLIN